jgi:hypothetical protein
MPTKGLPTPGTRRISFYDPSISTYLTGSLWRNCPLLEFLHDPSIGFMVDEQWSTFDTTSSTGDYVSTQATAGTAAIDTASPGTLKIDAGSSTSGQGMNLQRLKAGILPAANKSIWGEFYIALTANTPPVTKAQIFVGLAASDTTIIASGSQSTNNRIGWQIETSGLLVTTFTADKAGTATTKTGPTLVDATKIRLGFFYDGVADTLQQYVNGRPAEPPSLRRTSPSS